MIEAIKHCLKNLANPSGRDSRSTFWFYVLFLFIIYLVLSVGIGLVVAGGMMGEAFHAAQSGASEAETQKRMMERVTGTVRTSVWLGAVVSLVMTALSAMAFTRRLHDSGKPGWIAALVVAMQVAAVAMNIGMIDESIALMGKMQSGDMAAVQAGQARLMGRSLIGYIPMLAILIFGLMPSSDGDNRYGPEPDHL